MGESKRRKLLDPDYGKPKVDRENPGLLLQEITSRPALLNLAREALKSKAVLVCALLETGMAWHVEPRVGSEAVTWGRSARQFFHKAENRGCLAIALFHQDQGCALVGIPAEQLQVEA